MEAFEANGRTTGVSDISKSDKVIIAVDSHTRTYISFHVCRYQLPVLKLIEKEAKERKHRGKDLAKSQTEKAHIDAYVENLDGPLLFKNLYEEDREGNLLSKVKGAADLIAEFKHRFVPVCHQIFNLGMEEKTARDAEVALFWECFNEAMEEERKQGMNATSTFKEEQKAIFEKMRLESDPVKLEDMVKAYHVRVTELWDDLVGAEMHLVDELDEIVERFELSLSNFDTANMYAKPCVEALKDQKVATATKVLSKRLTYHCNLSGTKMIQT